MNTIDNTMCEFLALLLIINLFYYDGPYSSCHYPMRSRQAKTQSYIASRVKKGHYIPLSHCRISIQHQGLRVTFPLGQGMDL